MHPNGRLTHFWGSKISKMDGLEGRIHVYEHTEEGFFCTNQALCAMILPTWYAKRAENQMTLCKHTWMFANKLLLPSDTLNAPK